MPKTVLFIDPFQTMKVEHCQLACKAHECSDSIPELNKMVFAVQALGKFAFALRCDCC